MLRRQRQDLREEVPLQTVAHSEHQGSARSDSVHVSSYVRRPIFRWALVFFGSVLFCVVLLHLLYLQFLSVGVSQFFPFGGFTRDSELSQAVGMLYGVVPTSKTSAHCMIMPHLRIPKPGHPWYTVPGFSNCFDRAKCQKGSKLSVAIYPKEPVTITLLNGATLKRSAYFDALVTAIKKSPYYIEDPNQACILVPNFDHTLVEVESDAQFRIASALRSLPLWNGGMNHLLFNKHDHYTVQYDTGMAMVAKVGFAWPYYRPGFDISLPPPTGWEIQEWRKRPLCGWSGNDGLHRKNKYLLSFKGRLTSALRHAMMFLHNGKDIIVMHKNWDIRGRFDYDDLMLHSEFVLVPRGNGMYSYRLSEAIASGAIPVVIADHYTLPFSEFLNWKDFAVIVPEHEMLDIPNILSQITPDQRRILRCNLFKVWRHHFLNIDKHISSTLEVLSRRVYGFRGIRSTEGYLGHAGTYTTAFEVKEADDLMTGVCFELANTDVRSLCGSR